MSLLDEISSDLVNESADLSNTLRKAKMLSRAIGLPEFREWVDFELGGYPERDKVPSYRQFKPTNVGTFSGPFQSMIKNVVLPTYNLPSAVKEFADNLIFFEGIGELEALAAQAPDSHQVKWPQEMIILTRDSLKMTGGMVLVDAHQPIPSHLISGILDQVKNKLLDFVLDLQENNITSEDLSNHTVKPEIARGIFINNIYGDRNVIASGTHVNQLISTVKEGDLASLARFLREHNVEDSDIGDLEVAVSSEPTACKGRYGPKVRAWLGGMISKAASNTWNVGLEAASKILTEALKSYYGS